MNESKVTSKKVVLNIGGKKYEDVNEKKRKIKPLFVTEQLIRQSSSWSFL